MINRVTKVNHQEDMDNESIKTTAEINGVADQADKVIVPTLQVLILVRRVKIEFNYNFYNK